MSNTLRTSEKPLECTPEDGERDDDIARAHDAFVDQGLRSLSTTPTEKAGQVVFILGDKSRASRRFRRRSVRSPPARSPRPRRETIAAICSGTFLPQAI